MTPGAVELDRRAGGAIGRALKNGRFHGRNGDRLDLVGAGDGTYERVVLVGLGKGKERDALKVQDLGGNIVAHLNAGGVVKATVLVDTLAEAPLPAAPAAARLRLRRAAALVPLRQIPHQGESGPEADARPSSPSRSRGAKAAEDAFEPLDRVAEGVFFTRDLVERAGQRHLSGDARRSGRARSPTLGVKVEVLGVTEMSKLGMGALLGVGQGSDAEPRLVVMQWNGRRGNRDEQPIAFVGKGVTFDTGGISIKPAGGHGRHEMGHGRRRRRDRPDARARRRARPR